MLVLQAFYYRRFIFDSAFIFMYSYSLMNERVTNLFGH